MQRKIVARYKKAEQKDFPIIEKFVCFHDQEALMTRAPGTTSTVHPLQVFV